MTIFTAVKYHSILYGCVIVMFQIPDTSLKPENVLALRPEGHKVPNGLEMRKLPGSKLGSKLSFGSGVGGTKNNQVVPAITVEEADLEVRIAFWVKSL